MKCNLKNVDFRSTKHLIQLKFLYLNKTILAENLNSEMIKPLKNLLEINSQSFLLCCLAKKWNSKLKFCYPEKSILQTCSDMIGMKILKFILWIIVVLGLSGNLTALISNAFSKFLHKQINFIYVGLCLSDSMFIIYLCIIGSVDRRFSGSYMDRDFEWRTSSLCLFSGCLASIGILMSTYCNLLITIERFISINNPLTFRKFANQQKILIVIILFLIAFSLSIAPIFIFKVNSIFHLHILFKSCDVFLEFLWPFISLFTDSFNE